MLILVGGGSACGKGAFVETIKKKFPNRDKSIIGTDDYMKFGITNYKPEKETVESQVKKEIDCCDPQYLDIKSLKTDIRKELDKGSDRIIVVEGLHALIDEEIRKLADLKVFMEVDSDLRLTWKIKRSPWYKKSVGEEPDDPRRFGGKLPVALKRWVEGQKVGENKWILPTKKEADFVMICNTWPEYDKGMNKIAEFINTKKLPEKQKNDSTKELSERSSNDKTNSYNPWIVGGICLAVGLIVGILSAYFIWRKENKGESQNE